MSNQFLKLRRSAVPGKIPTTSSLEFGEIALNTYDGLAFMKKSGSNGEEIVTIGAGTTGSLFGTASWAINALTASSADNFIIREYLVVDGLISSSLIPSGSELFSIGSDTNRFKDIYLAGSTIHLGGVQLKETSGSLTIVPDPMSGITKTSFSGSFTGSLFGTASFAYTASYAMNVIGAQSSIATGNVTASVNTGYNGVFIIKSGSRNLLEMSGSGETTVQSNLFIIKNFTTQQPVLTVSESVVQIATHSFDPNNPTQAGSIWFTANNLYVALE